MNILKPERTEWIDLYKALGILLVVIGHTTPKFNAFLYQFHMAAFFILAGYMTDFQKDGFFHYCYKKLYSLFLPMLFLTALGACLLLLVNRAGLYGYLYRPDMVYAGVRQNIILFLKTGGSFVWFLGVLWFVWVLFHAELLSKVLQLLCGRTGFLYYLLSALLFVLGYRLIADGLGTWRMTDLTLIAQGYFAAGQAARNTRFPDRLCKNRPAAAALIGASCAYLCVISVSYSGAVDFPARQFGNIAMNFASGIAGGLLLWAAALGLCRVLRDGQPKRLLLDIGQNTLGILAFHLLIYKLLFALLVLLQAEPAAYLLHTTPQGRLQTLWPVSVAAAVTCSLGLWTLLKRFRFSRILLGDRDSWERLWNVCTERLRAADASRLSRTGAALFSPKLAGIRTAVRRAMLAAALLGVCVYLGYGWLLLSRSLTITFPYPESESVRFSGGWLPQDDEAYRWICGSGTITVSNRNWHTLQIDGYVPDSFETVNEVTVQIQGQEVYRHSLRTDRSFRCTADLPAEAAAEETCSVTITFDGVNIPDASSGEQRELSGFIQTITLK